jgi:MFS transporter, FHS family, L-fucose permease
MTEKRTSISKILPVMMAYLVMGFVDIVGVAVGYIKHDFELTDKQAQLLPSMIFVWFFVLSVPTGILMGKYGKKTILQVGIVLTALGMLVPLVQYSYPLMLASFVFLGIGNTIVQVALNPLLHDVVPGNKYSSYLSTTQFIKAICSLSGPIIATGMAAYLGNWKLVFLVYLVSSVISGLWLYFTKITEEQSKQSSASFSTCFSLLKNRFVLIMVLGIFLYVGAEVAMNTNIVGFLQNRFGNSLEDASLGISIFFTALMIGRFSGAVLLQWISAGKFFAITSLLSLLGTIGMLFSTSLMISKVLIFIIGLGFANVFPLIFSITVGKLPERVNEISGLMIMAIVGGAIVPPLMGFISSNFGLTASFILIVGIVVYIQAISLLYNRIENQVNLSHHKN